MLRVRQVFALALIVLTVLGTSGSWHAGGDDPDAPVLRIHDHQAHHELFRRGADRDARTHCAICHWLQSFESDAISDIGVTLADSTSGPGRRAPVVFRGSSDHIALPPRAPPA